MMINALKVKINAIFGLLIILCSSCSENRSYSINNLSGEWQFDSEISIDFENDNIVKCDTSRYNWSVDGTEFLRIFKDSTFIAYDTIKKAETYFLSPKWCGYIVLEKDSLYMLDCNAYPNRMLNIGVYISKLNNDTLILNESRQLRYCKRINQTIYIKKSNNSDFTHFSVPKNRIDTVTEISKSRICDFYNSVYEYNRIKRTYFYLQDTIYYYEVDIPIKEHIDTDSLLRESDKEFGRYYMGSYGDQAGVCGHVIERVSFVFRNYITFYNEYHDYSRFQYGAFHGDWGHVYNTYDNNGNKVLYSDVIKDSSRIDVNFLISDAIIEHRKQTGWLDGYDKADLNGLRIRYANVNYEHRIALGEEGLLVSLDYGQDDAQICFAENYIIAIIPYYKLKNAMKSPFDDLTTFYR